MRTRARVGQSDRLERTVAERIIPAPCHDLDRHTALKHLQLLLQIPVKLLERRLLGTNQCLIECIVLLTCHGAVDIIRVPLVVAGRKEGDIHIDGGSVHNGRHRVKEVQSVSGKVRPYICRHRVGGQRSRCDNGNLPVRDSGHLLLHDCDAGIGTELFRNIRRESVPVYRQCRAGGNLRGACRLHDERAHPGQFFLEQSDGVAHPVGAQGVGADQLRKPPAVVGRRHLVRLHLMQNNVNSLSRRLPCSLGAGKPGSVHVDSRHTHASLPPPSRTGGVFSGSYGRE